MTAPEHAPLDDLVRGHLDAAAAGVDAHAVLAGVKTRRAVVPHADRRAWLRWAAGAAVGAGLAAGVGGLVFFGGTPPVAVAATAEDLVRAARGVHARPLDRCYDVQIEWAPALAARFQLAPFVRKSRLWTRGDQFWIESATDAQSWAWGQDAGGRVWVSLGGKRGLVYDPTEIGEPIARYCELMSLRVVSTLTELLDSHDLTRQDGNTPGEPVLVSARLRPSADRPNPKFRDVKLTLDPATNVVRRATLTRQVNGEIVATLAFDLTATAPQPDAAYTLAGHLDAGAEVLENAPAGNPRADRRARFRDDFLKRMQSRVK